MRRKNRNGKQDKERKEKMKKKMKRKRLNKIYMYGWRENRLRQWHENSFKFEKKLIKILRKNMATRIFINRKANCRTLSKFFN